KKVKSERKNLDEKIEKMRLMGRPGRIDYQNVASPFPERWPYALELKKFTYPPPDWWEVTDDNDGVGETFHSLEVHGFIGDDDGTGVDIIPDWIGFYDPTELHISKDPLNELPMETYSSASAELVLDAELDPVNPP